MGIGKKIKYCLLGFALLSALVLCGVSILEFIGLSNTFRNQTEEATDKLYGQNVAEMTESSSRLAESLSNLYAQTINTDFVRISGELSTLKGAIEALYSGEGTQKPEHIERHKEYIISQAAELTPSQEQEIVQKLSAATPMFDNILSIESKISLAYVVLENGMVFSSSDTFYPEVEKADMRTRDWYIKTKESGALYWSELYQGTDKRQYVTVSIPVTDQDGQIFGILAFDLRVSEISERVLFAGNDRYVDAFLLNRKGEVLFSTEEIEQTYQEDYYTEFCKGVEIKSAVSGCYNQNQTIIGYAAIESTDWLLATVLDYDEVMAPVENVAESVSGTGDAMIQSIQGKVSQVMAVFAVLIVLVAILSTVTAGKVSQGITQPLKSLAKGADIIGGGELDYVIPVTSADEIGALAKNFNDMTGRLKTYIDEVAKAAGERQRLESELDVARRIQLGMLPREIKCEGYDIAGMMLPAKEVGGDFYDFFPIGEDRLCFVAADVSGKGVGAALFMTLAKMVIKTAAGSGIPVQEVMGIANELLCQENPAELFVTAFVGILTLSDGVFEYACAGHNPPVILKADGQAVFLEVRHKLPLAAMEGMNYPQTAGRLLPGETMILYTDGVTEATNRDNMLFGDDRLLEAAASLRGMGADMAIAHLKEAVDGFVQDAPQFDDITLVAMKREDGAHGQSESSD